MGVLTDKESDKQLQELAVFKTKYDKRKGVFVVRCYIWKRSGVVNDRMYSPEDMIQPFSKNISAVLCTNGFYEPFKFNACGEYSDYNCFDLRIY